MSLAAAARREGVSPATAYRWYSPGLRGGRVRLRLIRRGGRLVVPPGAIADFYRRLELDAEARRGGVVDDETESAAHAEADDYCRAEGL